MSETVRIEIKCFSYEDSYNNFQAIIFKTKNETYQLSLDGFKVIKLEEKFKEYIFVNAEPSMMNDWETDVVSTYYITDYLDSRDISIDLSREIWEYLEDNFDGVE